MTDYRFFSADGTTDFTLRTDFIPATSDLTTGNVTVCQVTIVADPSHFSVNWQKLNYPISAFSAAAIAQNLSLTGTPFGGSNVDEPGPSSIVGAVLATPVVTPTVISATEIDLNWPDVPAATSYTVDRATNAGFTTGVSLNIYTGATSAFNDTGRTTATHYYYRVTAKAANYQNSAYGLADAVTS